MKTVKYVMSVIVIIFCFVLGSELYQSYLQTFSNQFYFIDIENEDRYAIYSAVISAAERYNKDVFAVERKDIDAFHSQIKIYAPAASQQKLGSTYSIKGGVANSFFSGTTEVVFAPFEEIVNSESVNRYFFAGTKNDVASIRQNIYSQIATSYVHKETMAASNSLIYVVWSLSFGLLLLLTWLDIQFSRKSDFLEISLGGSVRRIICKNILMDSLFILVTFWTIYLILNNRIHISYKLNFAFFALLIFCVLNALLYFTLIKFNYKEIIYGANITGRLLSNTYLLKSLVMIMLVISLACNYTVINKSIAALRPYTRIAELSEYNTLTVTVSNSATESDEYSNKVETQLFLEAYRLNKVLLSTSCAKLDDPIIVLNDAAVDTVVSNPEYFQGSSSTFTVYIPQAKRGEIDDYDIEFAVRTTSSNFFGLEDYSFDVLSYPHTEVVYFDLRKVSELSYGFEMLSDPIIVLCNVTSSDVQKLLNNDPYIEFGDRWSNLLFNLSSTSSFSDDVMEQIDNVFFNSVVEQCDQHKNGLTRTVLINSILSAFLLVLSMLLISVIVKMEYLINAKELALKKILGYSLFRRNLEIVLLSVIASLIAFGTGLIVSNMYDTFTVLTLCVVSLWLFALDTLLLLGNMAVAENKNTAHILKGGSL